MIRSICPARKLTSSAMSVAFLLTLLCAFNVSNAGAQTTKPSTPQQPGASPKVGATAQVAVANDERAEQIVKRAIEAQGGGAYLNVRTVVGRGNFTPFAKGISTLPIPFIDYLALPDRERTEFRGRMGRSIQTNNGATSGWLYNQSTTSLKDMPPDQLEDFRTALRTGTDNLLRGWWRTEAGARLTYLGRREAGLAKRNEAVRLTYADGFTVDYELGAKDGLPAKTMYKRKTAEGEEVSEEERFAAYNNIAGVLVPFVVDHYRAGEQSSRINLDTVEINLPIPDALFAKPANFKAVK